MIRRSALITSAYMLCLAVSAGPVGAATSETWLGMYIGGQKVGYTHISSDRVKFEGVERTRMQSYVKTKMAVLGTAVQQEIRTVLYADERYNPKFETLDMTSGGRKSSVEARFGDKEIRCRVTTSANGVDSVVPIPEGASLVGDPMYALGTDKLKVGQKARMYYFNPLKLSVDPIDVEVLREEKLEVKTRVYDTFVVRNSTPMGDLTTWTTEAGALIQVLGVMGLTMQAETSAEAMAGIETGYVPPADLAVLTSVKANIDLPDARAIKHLAIRLSGKLEQKLAISDGRQKVTWVANADGTRSADFVINAAKFTESKSAKLPIKGPEFALFLKPTAYLESNAPEIKAKAVELVGTEKSAYAAAVAIRNWVNKNMKPQADIGIARPATDVLQAKVGVCRDYAVLYSALARSAGIPTKVVAGVVYLNGSFYYHAWAESYVGQWVPLDPTLPEVFVDATHIKLTEGDATDMFEMARVFGNLKAEITNFN